MVYFASGYYTFAVYHYSNNNISSEHIRNKNVETQKKLDSGNMTGLKGRILVLEQKGTSWGWIIFWFACFWPVGLVLLIKKLNDKSLMMTGKTGVYSAFAWF